MSTLMEKRGQISRKWYLLDAADKPLGKTAVIAAHILRGKHKPTFTPHADCGDHVVVVNAEKALLTGKKLEQKYYRHHSGWIGGLREIRYDDLMRTKPEQAMMLAIKGMLPDTVTGRKSLTRCRVYRGPQHENQAQKPEAWTL